METGGGHGGFSASEGIHAFLALRRKRRSATLQDSTAASSSSSSSSSVKKRITRKQSEQEQHLLRSSSTASAPLSSPLGRLQQQSSAQSTAEPLALERSKSEECLWAYTAQAPPNSIQHTYIASGYILQHPALIRALEDPNCGGIRLIERDYEYLRDLLPPSTKNKETTRLEADLILDEANAVLLYPLTSIGQAGFQDPEEGLNELCACLDRIVRRYSVLWLILEEYTWTKRAVGDQLASKASLAPMTVTAATKEPLQRLNPYTGPVVPRLVSLLSNVFCWEHQHLSEGGGRDCYTDKSFIPATMTGPHSPRWGRQVRVLFASTEESAARMIRQIGDGLAHHIDVAARAGLRREEDGWRSGNEWLSREWLNPLDSTHERFLNTFQLFNPFSIQAILSLCSLRDFLAMSTKQRQATVGKFTNITVLTQFDRMLTTPLSTARDYHPTKWL